VPLAGQQIAYRLWYLLSLSTDALAVPAQVYVSAALGTGDWAAAQRAARRTLVLGLAAGIGLPGVWAALGCWLAARSVLLGRDWAGTVARSGPGAAPATPATSKPGYE
jgi:Na+-driven multidrug efflux pump